MMRLAAALLFAASPAAATWLQCSATGTDAAGPFYAAGTSVEVGMVTAPRLAAYATKFGAAIARQNPAATGIMPHCNGFDDDTAAATAYSQALTAQSRRLGWEHIAVIAPTSWLNDAEIVEDPSRP